MTNTYTPPSWVKSKPHGSAEKQVGDADPQSRADVINRPGKSMYALMQRVLNTLFDGATLNASDPAATTPIQATLIQQAILTNKTGVSLVAGDVIAFDTANSSSVALGDTASSQKQFVIALESIANNASGRFGLAGSVVTVNVTGAVTRGNYLVKSATTKVLADSAIAMGNTQPPPTGAVALALTPDTTGTCIALILGKLGGVGGDYLAQWTQNHEWVEANGQKFGIKRLPELTTIAAAATTDTTILIPANAVVMAVSVRVTVTIPTITSFDVGVAGGTNRYGATLSPAAGTTNPGTNDATRFYAAAAAIRLTMNGTPPANTNGRVRVTIWYYDSTPPTS